MSMKLIRNNVNATVVFSGLLTAVYDTGRRGWAVTDEGGEHFVSDFDGQAYRVEIEPPPAPPAPPWNPSPVEFKLLFTPAERVQLRSLVSTDPVIADFFAIIDDPRLTFVNLSLSSTVAALDYLVGLDVLTSARKTAILNGEFQ